MRLAQPRGQVLLDRRPVGGVVDVPEPVDIGRAQPPLERAGVRRAARAAPAASTRDAPLPTRRRRRGIARRGAAAAGRAEVDPGHLAPRRGRRGRRSATCSEERPRPPSRRTRSSARPRCRRGTAERRRAPFAARPRCARPEPSPHRGRRRRRRPAGTARSHRAAAGRARRCRRAGPAAGRRSGAPSRQQTPHALLDRRRDGGVSRLVEVLDVVADLDVRRHSVEVEQLAAELAAHLREVRPEPVAVERRWADRRGSPARRRPARPRPSARP